MVLERIRSEASAKKGVKRFYFLFYRKLKTSSFIFFFKEKMNETRFRV